MPYVGGIWYSREMYAVFDRRKLSQRTIDAVTSPYQIWNNPKLKGMSSNDPAWVLGTVDQNTLDKLLKDPNLVVKEVYCGN